MGALGDPVEHARLSQRPRAGGGRPSRARRRSRGVLRKLPEPPMANDPEIHAGTESHYHSKKDRVFVRAIAGHYRLTEELKRLRALPRVRKGKEIKFVDGPQAYSRHYMEPKDGLAQTLHLHIEEYGPGG